ncbi:VanZ family protein [Bacillus suaedae]|uniref:VanZ family protein n=1 Tax=Halalkalibacter suaedae TaxID=2822140 RepID=A0A940WQV5_9BACI|nr:VanZ family protein [Bacillus suaedae]MBP3950138.1 VanZ family protein [Bacillus suaedae]
MNKFLLTVWTCLLFMFTFNSDFKGLLLERRIRFNFTTEPNFSHLFDFYTLSDLSNLVILQKIGHFFFFFILAFFLLRVFKRVNIVIRLGIAVAILTEWVQAFSMREARLQDVLIDVAGVLTFIVIYLVMKARLTTPYGHVKKW